MSRESPESMNPNALSLEDAARLLTKVGGGEISVDAAFRHRNGPKTEGAPFLLREYRQPVGNVDLAFSADYLENDQSVMYVESAATVPTA